VKFAVLDVSKQKALKKNVNVNAKENTTAKAEQ
jgi:hypothetical protein